MKPGFSGKGLPLFDQISGIVFPKSKRLVIQKRRRRDSGPLQHFCVECRVCRDVRRLSCVVRYAEAYCLRTLGAEVAWLFRALPGGSR